MAKNRDDKWFEELKEKHPALLERIGYASIGVGWSKLVSDLCFRIDEYQKQMPESHFEEPVMVVQIKEKFGGLRFYIYNADDYIRGMVDFAESMS